MRRIITMPVLVLHTADLPWGLLCRFVGFISLFPLFPLAKRCLVCFVGFISPVFLSSCLVLLCLFCSGLTCFLLPSLVLLLFPCPIWYCSSLCWPRYGPLVSVCVYPCLSFLLLHCLLCVLVKVKVEGMEWGMGFEFVVGRGI